MEDMQGGEWVGVDEAADIAGVSRWTIYRATSLELPYREVGPEGGDKRRRDRQYRKRDVESYRDKRRAGAKGRAAIEAAIAELRQGHEELRSDVDELKDWRDEHDRGH